MEDYLKSIAKNTEAKPSFYLVSSANESTLETTFSPPIDFSRGSYEIALMDLDTYYSFPNIDAVNNTLKVIIQGKTPKIIKIPTGCYEIRAINNELQRLMGTANKDKITITPNLNTLNCILTIKPG